MNVHTRMAILLLLGVIVVLAAGALMAAADPADTSNPPSADWVFDEGKTTTIKSTEWTIQYTITVINGSKLVLDECTWTFDGADPMAPIFIYTGVNSSLTITNSKFEADEGSLSFYIEVHDTLKIVNTEFIGMVNNPASDGDIACYEADVTMDFLTFHDNRAGDGIYAHNCQIAISNSKINVTTANAVRLFVGDNVFNHTYRCQIQDSEICNVTGSAVRLSAWTNYGNAVLDMYTVKIHDIKARAVALDVGDHSSSDNGNGSLYATFDNLEIYNIGDMAFYTSSLYQVTGAAGQNVYNVNLTNSTITNVTNTGIYVQLLSTSAYYSLNVHNTKWTDISITPNFDRIGAIWWWFQISNGRADLNVTDSTFKHCNPAAFYGWDYAGCSFYFANCTFTKNTQACINDNVQSGGSQSPMIVEHCQFIDNDGYGINTYVQYQWQGSCVPIMVSNSTFERNGMSALAVTSAGYEYSSNTGFNVTNCLIEHCQAAGIDINPSSPQGFVILHMENTRVNDTGGVIVGFDAAENWNGVAGCDVLIINSSIENSSATALLVKAISYEYSEKINLLFYNSSITNAAADGITVKLGVMYTYQAINLDAMIDMRNSTVDHVGGIALSMSCEPMANKGTRSFYIYNSHLYTAQRGIFSVGYGGEMWWSEVKGTLKEDIFDISAKIDLYYNKFSVISDSKFKALEGGEIFFYYDLTIYVKWDTGAPAVGANVELMDNTEKLISVMPVTNSTGALPTYTMEPYFVRETGLFSTSPYVINVTFLQVTNTVGVKLDYNKVVTIILEDHVNPEIYILRPKEGHVQQSTTLQIYGSAWDAQSGIKDVLISLDGENWFPAVGKLSWHYTFEVNESLIGRFSGVFNLRAKAVDYAHNERVAMVLVRIKPTPPQLTVDYPYDGLVTNNPELWVRGVTEVDSRVEINSVPVDLVVSMFTQKVMLVEGPNTISVISIDPLGNIQIVRMTVQLDTQKPYVILISPTEEGATTNKDTITVEAQLEEGLDVSINGRPIPYGSDYYPIGTGSLKYDVPLEPGENVLVIQARDKADNLLVLERVVTFDTVPPWIQVISPQDNAHLARPEVTVIGTVEPTATLLINDEDVTVQSGYFERTILCLEGVNDIALMATDLAGNVYNETVTVYIDTEEPTVKVTAPEQSTMIVKEKRFYINGTTAVKQGDGSMLVTATKVLLNGLAYTQIDDGTGQLMRQPIALALNGTFSIPVDLLEGKNDFTIEVQDQVGNRATASRTIRLDTHAPTLVVYIDPTKKVGDNLTSPSSTINITGYTDPGSVLTVKGILLPVADDGTFVMPYVLNPKGQPTDIVIDSMDPAGNVREIKQTITYTPIAASTNKATNWGLWFLVISLVILIVVGIVSAYVVRSRRDEWLEMEAARTTPLAPVVPLEPVKEPETLPGPEEIDIKEDEGKGAKPPQGPVAAARPRPRPPQARRGPPARPVPKAPEAPKGDSKDLSDQGAEADIGADETDQEGM